MKTAFKPLVLKFYSDSSHGWVAVKAKVLVELGIADKISSYSYQRGDTKYVEEDKDLSTLVAALKSRGWDYKIVEGKFQDRSPIRSYDRYQFN